MEILGGDDDGMMGFISSMKRPAAAASGGGAAPSESKGGMGSGKGPKQNAAVEALLKENDADYFNEFTIDDDLDAEMPVPAPAPPRKSVVPEDADEGADDNEQLEVPADDNGDSRQAAGDEAAKLNGAGAEAEAAAEEDAPAHSSPVQPPAADRTADKAAPSQLASPATPSATVCQTEDLVVDTLEPAGDVASVEQPELTNAAGPAALTGATADSSSPAAQSAPARPQVVSKAPSSGSTIAPGAGPVAKPSPTGTAAVAAAAPAPVAARKPLPTLLQRAKQPVASAPPPAVSAQAPAAAAHAGKSSAMPTPPAANVLFQLSGPAVGQAKAKPTANTAALTVDQAAGKAGNSSSSAGSALFSRAQGTAAQKTAAQAATGNAVAGAAATAELSGPAASAAAAAAAGREPAANRLARILGGNRSVNTPQAQAKQAQAQAQAQQAQADAYAHDVSPTAAAAAAQQSEGLEASRPIATPPSHVGKGKEGSPRNTSPEAPVAAIATGNAGRVVNGAATAAVVTPGQATQRSVTAGAGAARGLSLNPAQPAANVQPTSPLLLLHTQSGSTTTPDHQLSGQAQAQGASQLAATAAISVTPEAVMQAKAPARPLKPPAPAAAPRGAARPSAPRAAAAPAPAPVMVQGTTGLLGDTTTPPPGAMGAALQPTPTPPGLQQLGGAARRSLASPLDRVPEASPAGQAAADSSAAVADAQQVPGPAAAAPLGMVSGMGPADASAAVTGAAAEAEVALTTAQGPEVQEFATAVAPVNHALSSDKRSAAAAATATGDDGPRAGDKLTTGDGDGGSGFAGFSPLPPPKRARGLLDEAAQLPSNYLGAIRALELKIVEAQQMQHAVMELRVRAAMQSNRLVLLDNPPLRAHLKKLKAKAQGLMEAVHGSSQAVAASQ